MGSAPDGESAASDIRPVPSGTVTLLFSDIEGSTVRWDRDAAAMEVAVRVHDVIMRDAIVAHDGYVFRTIGDAFCAWRKHARYRTSRRVRTRSCW